MRLTTGNCEREQAIGEGPCQLSLYRSRASQVRAAVLLAFAVAMASIGLACRVASMDHPQRMLSPSRDPEVVAQAIEKALQNRGWHSQRETPGSILATLDNRGHQVVVRITYSESSFEVAYISSKDMMYEVSSSGTEKIHRNYNGWVANVMRDTEAYLAGREPEGGLTH